MRRMRHASKDACVEWLIYDSIASLRLCEYKIRYADHFPTEKIMFRAANNYLGQ